MSDRGNPINHIERLLGVKLEQEYPGDPRPLKARWFHMRSPSGERLDLTTESQKLRESFPQLILSCVAMNVVYAYGHVMARNLMTLPEHGLQIMIGQDFT